MPGTSGEVYCCSSAATSAVPGAAPALPAVVFLEPSNFMHALILLD